MYKNLRGILVKKADIDARVAELGKMISEDYKGKNLVLVGVLKGGFVFLADLMRQITIPVEIDFIATSSYTDASVSSGVVKIVKDIDTSISDKHVLIVEDIIDTGLTLHHLQQLLMTRSPLSVKICAIFDKVDRRKVDIPCDYQGIVIPDKFVVGYGLDYAGMGRNLPDLYEIGTDD